MSAGCRRATGTDKPLANVTEGWNYFRQGDNSAAATVFNRVLASLDENPTAIGSNKLRLQALYGLAQTQDLGFRDSARAAILYHQIIRLAAASDEAAWSWLALARMKHVIPVGQEPALPAVRRGYQDVIDHFPDHPAAQEAFIYQQATFVSALDPELARESLASLQAFIRDHPNSKFIGPAWHLSSFCQKILGNTRADYEAYLKSIETQEVDATNPLVDNASPYWYLATTAEFDLGDFDTAREYYRKLIAKYPNDQKVFPAQQALLRMDQLEQSVMGELRSVPPGEIAK